MTTNIKLASQVAKFVELTSITLRSAQIDATGYPDELPEEIGVSHRHRCTFEERNRQNKKEIHVFAEFKFSASSDNDEGEESPFVKLDATFALVYALRDGAHFDPKCLQHFAEVNGAYNAWPYWRELVQSAAGRCGLAGIVVPVYRPVAVEVDEETKSKSREAKDLTC